MAQKTSWNGAALTESDINTYLMGEGGAWTSWTPALTQSGAVAATVVHARYARHGRRIEVTVRLSVTGTGTAGVAVTMSLPVTAATSSGVYGSGTCAIFDVSATQDFHAQPFLNTATTILFLSTSTNAQSRSLGATSFTAALASGDLVLASFSYEAAT